MWLSSLHNEPIKSPSLTGVGCTAKTSLGSCLVCRHRGSRTRPERGVSGKEERGELSWSNSKLHLVGKKTQICSMTLLLPSMAWLYILHVYFITVCVLEGCSRNILSTQQQRKLILSPTQILDLETEHLKHDRQILYHWAMFPAGHITELCSWKCFLKIFSF